MRKLSKRSTAVVAGVAVVVIGGGAAWAATGWTIPGTGTANASAATIKPVTATSTFASNIFPDANINFSTKFSNPNEFAVILTGAISITGAVVTPADANATTCAAALDDAGMFETSFPGSPKLEANTDTTVAATVKIGSLPEACASKTIKISYSVPGVSAGA
ncbi:hypothetical protein [Actinoplanes awajinensis]|uniref:Ribosomally synthesized peptide with SipW-like signal peptide n=1 Tax=Actinoplanes awajinensis subsp. mycoplanecinus TaxID=135947 RepID=A0A117MPR6_9ACTN|nr:hypothetical protein [Actinoplanes awajinensis]KUL29077.1 hypothetical protein ADL15_29800 [Actinoplanes awajinensis subsp. mycoplanecinus]